MSGLRNPPATSFSIARACSDESRREAVRDNPQGMRELMLETPNIIKRPIVVFPDGTITIGVVEDAWERLAP